MCKCISNRRICLSLKIILRIYHINLPNAPSTVLRDQQWAVIMSKFGCCEYFGVKILFVSPCTSASSDRGSKKFTRAGFLTNSSMQRLKVV